MNILTTALIVGTLSALPAGFVSTPQIENPLDGLSISAAGIHVDFTVDGIKTQAAKTTDFQFELRLKSGAPIRVRL